MSITVHGTAQTNLDVHGLFTSFPVGEHVGSPEPVITWLAPENTFNASQQGTLRFVVSKKTRPGCCIFIQVQAGKGYWEPLAFAFVQVEKQGDAHVAKVLSPAMFHRAKQSLARSR